MPKLFQEDSLEARLAALLVGQDEAIETIAPFVYAYAAGIAPSDRPAGVVAMLGPTGSGKTHCVESVASVLHGSHKNLLRVDCGEFQMEHEVAKLVGCFTPETAVTLADGSRKPIKDIAVGDKVVTKEGRTRPVTWLHQYEHDGDMVQLSIASHSEKLTATPNHKILAIRVDKTKGRLRNPKALYDPSKLEWVPAGELQRNDIVVYPRFKADETKAQSRLDLVDFLSEEGGIKYDEEFVWFAPRRKTNRFIEVNEDFVRFMGYFVSDGCTRSGKGGVHFTLGVPQKSEVVDDLLKIIPRLFGDGLVARLEAKGPNCVRVVISSKVLAVITAKLFGTKAETKHLPAFALHLSDHLLWHLIDAALMCDGSVVVRRRVDYSTSSETLYSQLQLLLRKLGFTSQVQRHKSARYGVSCLDRYRIYVSGEQIDRFAYQLPLSGKKVGLDNPGNDGIQRQSHVDEDYVYFRIKSLDTVRYSGPVYDIAVDEDTSYIAANVAVSNSPPGYLGHRETQPMLSQAKVNSVSSDRCGLSIILFDEIEKAAASMTRLMLGLLDKATLKLGDNSNVNFENCLIFMTSNLGADTIQKNLNPKFGLEALAKRGQTNNVSYRKLQTIGGDALKRRFSPEFVNRIDAVITYKPLSEDSIWHILSLQLEALGDQFRQRLGPRSPELRYEGTAMSWLRQHGFSTEYGARELRRLIDRTIRYPIGKLIALKQILPGELILVKLNKRKNTLEFQGEISGRLSTAA